MEKKQAGNRKGEEGVPVKWDGAEVAGREGEISYKDHLLENQ